MPRIPPKQADSTPVKIVTGRVTTHLYPGQSMPVTPIASVQEATAQECAKAWAEKRYNVATGLLIGLAAPAPKDLRIAILDLIDQNAEIRGYISERDSETRKAIGLDAVQEAWARLGFDPRFPRPAPIATPVVDAPKAIPAPLFATPKALPAPAGPLVAGDYADLDRRVKAGEISPEQAQEIAGIWGRYSAQA